MNYSKVQLFIRPKISRFSLLPGALIVCAVLLNLGGTGCKPFDRKAEVKQVDSLKNLSAQVYNTLNVDLRNIKLRRDSLEQMLEAVNRILPDSGDEGTKTAMLKLGAIQKGYDRILVQYPEVQFDYDKEKTELDVLLKQYEGGRIQGEGFNTAYAAHKAALTEQLTKAREYDRLLYSMEKDYLRTTRMLKPWAEKGMGK